MSGERPSILPGARTTAHGFERVPRTTRAVVSAWAIALLVVGEFAMLAVVPVVVLTATVFRDARLRVLRWWAAVVAATYASGLAAWAIGPDRAPSLSKDLHPLHSAVIVAASLAFVLGYHLMRRRPS